MNREKALITKADRSRLGSWLVEKGNTWADPQCYHALEMFLERADTINAVDAPENLVTMNSAVTVVDLDTGETRSFTLVYPEDYDLAPDPLSITEPLGLALLGARVGDEVHGAVQDRERRLRVVEIVYQPEQAGALHL